MRELSPARWLCFHMTGNRFSNVLREQSARNPKIVRLINKFPNPPNKDVGEGLNTAFAAMKKLRLKEPEIVEKENSVIVYIHHSPLASSEDMVMKYLDSHEEITNAIGRPNRHSVRELNEGRVFAPQQAQHDRTGTGEEGQRLCLAKALGHSRIQWRYEFGVPVISRM
jgi:hypothetical protein